MLSLAASALKSEETVNVKYMLKYTVDYMIKDIFYRDKGMWKSLLRSHG